MSRFVPTLAVAALLPFASGCPSQVERNTGLDAPVAVEEGGTGATDAATARANLASAGLTDSNTFGATQTISAGATAPGLVLVAAAGQVETLQQWRSSTGAVVASVGPDGALTGGIARMALLPSDTCVLVGGGTSVECGGIDCGAAAASCLAAAAGCQGSCIDATSPTFTLAYPAAVPTTIGLMQVFVPRPALICRADVETWVDLSVAVGGIPVSNGTVLLGSPLAPPPLAVWREMPAPIDSGSAVGAGATPVSITGTMNANPPYDTAVCFVTGPTLTVTHTPGMMGGL